MASIYLILAKILTEIRTQLIFIPIAPIWELLIGQANIRWMDTTIGFYQPFTKCLGCTVVKILWVIFKAVVHIGPQHNTMLQMPITCIMAGVEDTLEIMPPKTPIYNSDSFVLLGQAMRFDTILVLSRSILHLLP